MRVTTAASLALVMLAPGCDRCSPKQTKTDAVEPAPTATATIVAKEELLPPPSPWTFKPARFGPGMPSFALPEGCKMREPLVRARVAATTRFVAAPQGTGALVVADADPSEAPPKLVGVAGVLLDAQGASKEAVPLPWRDAAAMPRLARSAKGAWLAASTFAEEEGPSSVFVYQDGKVTPLGEGDRFEAADMSCGATRCALLTTRLGNVLAAGAEVWMGGPDEPAATWRKVEITPTAGESNARPSVLARVDGNPVATLLEGGELVFVEVDAVNDGATLGQAELRPKPQKNETRELGRVPAPHGMIDATMAETPTALVYGAEVDDEGCAREGGKIHVSRPGKDPIELRAQAPPTSGALRPLARGTLAAWLAPLGCGLSRKVVYAVLLDPEGKPTSAPMPVADASSFAVAAHGEDVDLWIQHDDEVTWLRASCAASAGNGAP